MEVFAVFNIFDDNGKKVAEGHKASFCLEDNECLDDVEPKYACADYGDQGIMLFFKLFRCKIIFLRNRNENNIKSCFKIVRITQDIFYFIQIVSRVSRY